MFAAFLDACLVPPDGTEVATSRNSPPEILFIDRPPLLEVDLSEHCTFDVDVTINDEDTCRVGVRLIADNNRSIANWVDEDEDVVLGHFVGNNCVGPFRNDWGRNVDVSSFLGTDLKTPRTLTLFVKDARNPWVLGKDDFDPLPPNVMDGGAVEVTQELPLDGHVVSYNWSVVFHNAGCGKK